MPQRIQIIIMHVETLDISSNQTNTICSFCLFSFFLLSFWLFFGRSTRVRNSFSHQNNAQFRNESQQNVAFDFAQLNKCTDQLASNCCRCRVKGRHTAHHTQNSLFWIENTQNEAKKKKIKKIINSVGQRKLHCIAQMECSV